MNNEWLTTGQMIHTLNEGQSAESEHGIKITRKRHGLYFDIGVAELSDELINVKWRILPNYVTLEEAIKAHEDGKTVVCHYPSAVKPEHCKQSFNKKKGETSGDMSFYMMVVGKWTIEADTP